MTTLNNDELREKIDKAISGAMGQLRPVIKPERASGVMGVMSASDMLRIDILDIIAAHDQQLLEAILEGAEPNPTTPAGENEFVPVEHIKSVFNKEGE